MNTAKRIVGGVNASRVARQALSWATGEARLGRAPLLIVRDQPNAADAVGLDVKPSSPIAQTISTRSKRCTPSNTGPGTNDQRDSPQS